MQVDPLEHVRSVIAHHWGFRGLRPLQEKAIQTVLERRDSLVVMPTGGGKSLCYQAPAASRPDEITVVVSPLLALMKDQVDHLTAAGVPALRIDSTLTDAERLHAMTELKANRIRVLFVSPERLAQDRFQQFLHELGIRTFAIDEAHCISDWGHDFRPEYRQLRSLRDRFPQASVHAFTATATEKVRSDIVEQLGLHNPKVLVGNFDRPNLTYRVLPRQKEFEQVTAVLERHSNEAGIIYCTSRKQVDELTARLRHMGINAMSYRAANPDEPQEVNQKMRQATHDAFRAGTCDLVVATVAFGMGIDRPDIRFVLHTGMPKAMENYQQEAGRAGRDGLEAECILICSGQDAKMWKDINARNADDGNLTKDWLDHANEQVEKMFAYTRSGRCRHRMLVEHFGQPFEKENCEACDICLGEIEFETDSKTIAQKILSCVARAGERYGVGYIADILRGKAVDRAKSLGHDKLSTFGLLADHSLIEVKDWITQLVFEDVLSQTSDEYPTLRLNDESWRVMRGQREVRLTRRRSGKQAKSVGETVSWEGVDPRFFENMRLWRRELAAQAGLPPYTIVNDSTLREIVRIRPTSLQNLRLISGIGDARLQAYGPAIIDLVAKYSREFALGTDIDAPPPNRPALKKSVPEGAYAAFPHFEQKKSIAEIARLLDRAESTVNGYLCNFIEETKPEQIDTWVPIELQEKIATVAREQGFGRMKPIFLALEEKIPYDLIRITISYLQNQNTRTATS
jgi:ATP-dependent DNA helicase RecQ